MFNIGDRVKVSDKYLVFYLAGRVGTVKGFHMFDRCIGVEFDEHINGHNFNGECSWNTKGKDGHCWFFDCNDLELVDKKPVCAICDAEEGLHEVFGKHMCDKCIVRAYEVLMEGTK